MEVYEMPTDIQFKYELRKQLTNLYHKLELLENGNYEDLKKEFQNEIEDIKASLQD